MHLISQSNDCGLNSIMNIFSLSLLELLFITRDFWSVFRLILSLSLFLPFSPSLFLPLSPSDDIHGSHDSLRGFGMGRIPVSSVVHCSGMDPNSLILFLYPNICHLPPTCHERIFLPGEQSLLHSFSIPTCSDFLRFLKYRCNYNCKNLILHSFSIPTFFFS